MPVAAVAYQRGIVTNLGQFTLQTIQVFFVGLTIGMERTVLPALSGEFGVAKGAYLFLASFVLSFGLVKGALNRGRQPRRPDRSQDRFAAGLAGRAPHPTADFLRTELVVGRRREHFSRREPGALTVLWVAGDSRRIDPAEQDRYMRRFAAVQPKRRLRRSRPKHRGDCLGRAGRPYRAAHARAPRLAHRTGLYVPARFAPLSSGMASVP